MERNLHLQKQHRSSSIFVVYEYEREPIYFLAKPLPRSVKFLPAPPTRSHTSFADILRGSLGSCMALQSHLVIAMIK